MGTHKNNVDDDDEKKANNNNNEKTKFSSYVIIYYLNATHNTLLQLNFTHFLFFVNVCCCYFDRAELSVEERAIKNSEIKQQLTNLKVCF